ncbi:unnamed protein product [Ilex paraguariensis]|uniref:PRA1 family protein n=1 Tax=Ilex paraguariensis TaxID=185542 RepID=A0ABC8RZB2_9AQUA
MSSNRYTTIPPPISPQPSAPSLFSTLRPWQLLLDPSALSLPISFSESIHRINQNLHYFRLNYTLIILFILFLSLLYHPISVLIFFITIAAWVYLSFNRNEPLVVLDRTIDDRFVLGFLCLLTVFALILANVWWNVIVSGMIGFVIVCLHAVIRTPEDEESLYGALLSDSDSPRGRYARV